MDTPGKVLSIYDSYIKTIFRILLTAMNKAPYMRLMGTPGRQEAGRVLSDFGTGATNLVTGLATAYMDSVPVILWTGAHYLTGQDTFQEADITGITCQLLNIII